MNNKYNKSIKGQQGAAAIYLALLLIPLFGVIFLALEGTRYIQKNNRLGDAAEAATIAIALANKPNNIGENKLYNDNLADDYVTSYMRHIEGANDIEVIRRVLVDEEEEGGVIIEDKNYVRYQVIAQTKHKSWLHNDLIPSFKETEIVGNKAVARVYPISIREFTVDIVLVTDFSNSMTSYNNEKINMLKNAVDRISNEILVEGVENEEDDRKHLNRIAIVPFDVRVKGDDKNMCGTQINYTNPRGYDDKTKYLPYEIIDWTEWGNHEPESIAECAKDAAKCEGLPEGLLPEDTQLAARTITTVLDMSNVAGSGNVERVMDSHEFVDIEKTVKNVFVKKGANLAIDIETQEITPEGSVCAGNFWTIPLTNNIATLSAVQDMDPGNATAAYQGIIRGAQVLDDGKPDDSATDEEIKDYKNRLKMIIVLTDGKDLYRDTLPDLVDAGLCTTIRDNFDKGEFPGTLPLHMSVIGLKFDPGLSPEFGRCVGEENVKTADDVDSLVEEILKIMNTVTVNGGIPKLYYRNTTES